MGHAQSKRKKRSQTRLRRKIEHVTHEQTRSSWSAGANGSATRARNFNPGRKFVQKSARWREPSPEKLETLERRQRDAANRTRRSRSRSQQSRSRSPKRQSQSRANLNESDSNLKNPKMQHYRKEVSRENLKMRNPETTRGRNFSRRSGTWFCVVRCRSEPPLGNHQNKAARVDHLPPRKSASSSPARRVRRELESTPMYQNGLQHFVNQRKQNVKKREFDEKTPGRVRTSAREEHELDRSFQASHGNVINDEIGISFEQVEPKLLRLFGSSAKSGPIPQTNRVAPRALRRSFPNLASHVSRKEPNELAPKRNFISRTAKDKSVSESRLQKLAAQHFPKPPIPPRKQKLSDLAHLVQQSSPKLPSNANQHQQQHTNRNNQINYGSVETLSSFSSQSGSYHLPSSANFSTLPDRSLAESPHALQIDSDFEKYSEDESADALYIRTIPQTPPLTVEAAYRRNDQPTVTVPSSPETGKKNLLWSNPSPFGSQPLQKVIRSVQAPIQKPQNLHWPPLKTDSHKKRNRITSRAPPVPLRPPQMSQQLERKPDEISVSPLRLPVSPRERPRSAVQDRVYRDILFDNTERTSFPIKSGLSKTLRPSIEDLVSILAEPIPPHNRKSQRNNRSFQENSQSEEILINELKSEKKRPGILKNANTTSSSRVVEVLYHEPRSRKTDQERGNNRGRAEHPPIFLGEDDFGNNWIDLTQPATTLYLNDY